MWWYGHFWALPNIMFAFCFDFNLLAHTEILPFLTVSFVFFVTSPVKFWLVGLKLLLEQKSLDVRIVKSVFFSWTPVKIPVSMICKRFEFIHYKARHLKTDLAQVYLTFVKGKIYKFSLLFDHEKKSLHCFLFLTFIT